MFKKIILGILIILISINIINAEQIIIEDDSYISNSAAETGSAGMGTQSWFYIDVDYGIPQFASLTVAAADWGGSAIPSQYVATNFKIGAVVIGTGMVGYIKSSDGTQYYKQMFFNEDWDASAYSGYQKITVTWADADTRWLSKASNLQYATHKNTGVVQFCSLDGVLYQSKGTHYTEWRVKWTNTINYFDNSSYYYMTYDRDASNTSKVKITQSTGHVLINEAALSSSDFQVVNTSIVITDWYFNVYTNFGFWHNFSITFREAPSTAPFLITNKTNYLTSEDILISWGNMLNLPLAYTPATLELQIKYTEGTNEYLKWNEILDYHEYDGNRIISAAYFIPQTNYTLYITDAEFPDSPLYHTTFNVKQTNDDYITTNKNYPPHQVYSGQTIQIYYQAQNTSKLNIVDNDNNLISSYTVSGIGTKNYNIPTDITKSYSYPYWYVYLNDTVTSISLNQSIKVVWVSEPQITPTIPPTVQKTPDITSNDTTEILTELKNGTKPLIDLVYGIGFIFVDNPDYDDNSVVSIDEMNQWFNSLVKVGIFILLITFYFGFKREEQLRK